MTAKIGDKEYCLDGYTNLYILPELLEKVYQQGRAEALDEFVKKFRKNYGVEEWEEYVANGDEPIPYSWWLAEQIKEQKND